MGSTDFGTKRIGEAPDAIALDGSEVRLLCGLSRGGMATFTLMPEAVSKAVAHRTIVSLPSPMPSAPCLRARAGPPAPTAGTRRRPPPNARARPRTPEPGPKRVRPQTPVPDP